MDTLETILLTTYYDIGPLDSPTLNQEALVKSRQAVIADLEADLLIMTQQELDLATDYREAIQQLRTMTDQDYLILRDQLVPSGR